MTLRRTHPGSAAPSHTTRPRGRQFRWWPVAAVIAALAAAAAGGVAIHVLTGPGGPQQAAPVGYHIGDCVAVKPGSGAELHAAKAPCNTDPSFVISAFTDSAQHCNPDRFDRFGPPRADPETGMLCLEPNLVAGHCYLFGDPVGMWRPADCGGRQSALIKVTKRVEVDDPNACSSAAGDVAMAYPSPPRTYCTAPAQ